MNYKPNTTRCFVCFGTGASPLNPLLGCEWCGGAGRIYNYNNLLTQPTRVSDWSDRLDRALMHMAMIKQIHAFIEPVYILPFLRATKDLGMTELKRLRSNDKRLPVLRFSAMEKEFYLYPCEDVPSGSLYILKDAFWITPTD